MSDTREKLIELIKNSPTTNVVYGNCKLDRPIRTVQTIADHLIANGVTVQRWIPVSERLPEEDAGEVLVAKQYRGHKYIDVGKIIEGEAYCYSDEFAINRREHILTHWMPLPEPPKGE